jgi:hypothetical protein
LSDLFLAPVSGKIKRVALVAKLNSGFCASVLQLAFSTVVQAAIFAENYPIVQIEVSGDEFSAVTSSEECAE